MAHAPEQPTVDVVAVGAHPDDVEIGCGGTLALLAQLGYQVAIVDLTDGEPTPNSPGPEVRLAEAQAAARTLGAVQRHTLPLPNRRLMDTWEARVKLATLLRRLRPRVVLSLGARTPLASPDHWQAALITEAAVFYSRLTKWDHEFDDLPPHRIEHLLYYPLGFSLWKPDTEVFPIVVDISTTMAIKMEAIGCYQTQFPPEKRHVLQRVQALAHAQGALAGVEAAEVLWSPRTVVVRDPIKWITGEF